MNIKYAFKEVGCEGKREHHDYTDKLVRSFFYL